ncbi:hypothetical protein, partial [Neisseria sp. P0018.S002]|uniref:hypothetical protein n=1 Tax=Neisseria sp. P0018.S002 TaxID=3436788 RepID=UPI003F7F911F
TNIEKPDSTVTVAGADNINTEAPHDTVTVTLKKELVVNSVEAGDATVNKEGVEVGGDVGLIQNGVEAGEVRKVYGANLKLSREGGVWVEVVGGVVEGGVGTGVEGGWGGGSTVHGWAGSEMSGQKIWVGWKWRVVSVSVLVSTLRASGFCESIVETQKHKGTHCDISNT